MSVFVALPIAFSIAVGGALAMAVITGVRRGWEPDVAGSRARALYIYALAFAALVVAAFSIAALVAAIVQIILPNHGISVSTPGGLGFTPGEVSDKENANEAVLAGLFAIAALLIFLFQYRRGNEALAETGWLESPAGRIRRGYLYFASFVWVVIALFAGVFAAFGLYQIIVPGTAGLGTPNDLVRDKGIVQLASLGVLALVAVGAFVGHWRRLLPRRAGGAPPATTVPVAPPPPAPPAYHAPPAHTPPHPPPPPHTPPHPATPSG